LCVDLIRPLTFSEFGTPIGPHIFRHLFITFIRKEEKWDDAAMETLARAMGHTRQAQERFYVLVDKQRDAVDMAVKWDNVLRGNGTRYSAFVDVMSFLRLGLVSH
jgi:integrase